MLNFYNGQACLFWGMAKQSVGVTYDKKKRICDDENAVTMTP